MCRQCTSRETATEILQNVPKKRGAKSPLFKGYGELSHSYFTNTKHGAIGRGLSFDVTIKYLWDLFLMQDRKCALSGIPLSFSSCYACKDGNASLDRIDSTRGYIPGNVQWVHQEINYLKSNLPNDVFINYCKAIARTHQTPSFQLASSSTTRSGNTLRKL